MNIYESGAEVLACIEHTGLDLAILDVMFPDADGFQICKKIRETSYCPVIMLTAGADDGDKIMGLALGAGDYIKKPFSPFGGRRQSKDTAAAVWGEKFLRNNNTVMAHIGRLRLSPAPHQAFSPHHRNAGDFRLNNLHHIRCPPAGKFCEHDDGLPAEYVWQSGGSQVRLQFSNHGGTIPKEKLERIFEQFYRLDAGRGTDGAGPCHRQADRHTSQRNDYRGEQGRPDGLYCNDPCFGPCLKNARAQGRPLVV